jgi:LuxR family glucitol operon transcriptional activator
MEDFMSSYQRIALFIFFDAIEKDLVSHIRSVSPHVDDKILTAEERDKAQKRSERNDDQLSAIKNDFDLLYHLDLGDKLSIINRIKDRFEVGLSRHLSSKSKLLQRSISVRNSVMHGRPLTVEEHANAFALANDLVKSSGYWPILFSEITDYNKDPEGITRKSINIIDDPSEGLIFHNLPLPDYDDTGFVPRPALEQELNKKIRSRHPVVTVLGDGGNGKTALTVQALYSLVNSGDHDFEAVVWVSAKSSKLTVGEIQRIENAIKTSIGIFEEVSNVFKETPKDPLGRVRELLHNNKVLLVIDNLETVLDSTIRDFVTDIPGSSKVLFTSRIPVGGDLTVTVNPLSEGEGEIYLRALIKSYSISTLAKLTPDEIKYYSNRLGRRPLLLKWFCLGVMSGLSPKKIVSNPEIALRFCLDNVFNALTPNARNTLSLLSILPRSASIAVLHYISLWDVKKLESGIAELIKFSIIEGEDSSAYEYNYNIKPFSRAYIAKILSIENKERDEIIGRFRTLTYAFQEQKGNESREKYNIKNYTVRSLSEALAVQKLRLAVKAVVHQNDISGADEIISNTKISNPDYFEVYRTEAFICYHQKDIIGAKQAYEAAIDLSPETPQLYYFFGGFLLRAYEDYLGAIENFTKSLQLDPESSEVKRELARAKMFNYDFEEADQILAEELKKPLSSLRHHLIFSDLRCQNFRRIIGHISSTGIDADFEAPFSKFLGFLQDIDCNIVDHKMLDNIKKAKAVVSQVASTRIISTSDKLISALNVVVSKAEFTLRARSNINCVGNESIRSMGTLKEKGRKPSFGFLVDAFGNEFFLSRSEAGEEIWNELERGRAVSFEVTMDSQNRTKATKLELEAI